MSIGSSRIVVLGSPLRTSAVCAGLFVATSLLFSRALDYGFSNFDDPGYVTSNLHVRAGLVWESIAWAFTGRADYWHPLTWISHMIDWQFYGDSAYGHHRTSVLWHALNSVLAFLLLRRLTGQFWASAFCAALFAWHPLRVESVVWITERKDVMSGCFFMLTVWAYAIYATERTERRSGTRYYLLALSLFAMGLMCKPVLVALPAVLFALDFWPLCRFRGIAVSRASSTTYGTEKCARDSSWWLFIEKIPFLALSLVISIVTILMQQGQKAFTLHLSLAARLCNALVSVSRYLGKCFWPFDLAVVYPHPGNWPFWSILGSALFVVGISALVWSQRHARPWLITGWIWFLAMLLPSIGIVQSGRQAMADRYTYIAIMGLMLALAGTIEELARLRRGGRKSVQLFGGALLLGCLARTWDQESFWRNSTTLFQHAVDVTTRNDLAHAGLAFTFMGLGKIDEAARECELALEINPQNEMASFAMARVRERQGRIDEAIFNYLTVVQLDPDDAQTEYRLGVLLLQEVRTVEAKKHLQSAVLHQLGLKQVNLDAAGFDARRGRFDDAIVRYEVAVEVNPTDVDSFVKLGDVLNSSGQHSRAIARWKNASELNPDFPGLRQRLANMGKQ